MVVIIIRTMGMTMFDFFLAGLTDINNLNGEVQINTGQRVVAINSDIVVLDIGNCNYHGLTFRALGMELHAGFDLLFRTEHVTTDNLQHGFITFTITIAGLYGHVDFITG